MKNINKHRKLFFVFFFLCTILGTSFQSRAKEQTPLINNVIIDYQNANLDSVLKAFAFTYDLNLVITKDIQGKVSASLKNVTIDQALEAMLSVNGYMHTRKDNIIYIIPGAGIEKIGRSTALFHLSYLTAVEARELLSEIVSLKGSIKINEATNSLVITDFPAYIKKIQNILPKIDVPPIQVLIEAKIIDIQSKVFKNFGSTYTLDYSEQSELKGIFGRNTSSNESLKSTTTLAGPSTSLSGGEVSINAILKGFSLNMTIDALVQDNKAHILASPSIATLNGKEARIIIGERFPFLETTRDATGTATETTKFVDVGTALRVTPLVSPNGWITMKIHPEVSSVSASLSVGPRITTREAESTVRVKDKQTIVIGGLISKKDDRVEGGIPGLKSIPLLGKLFSKRSSDVEETELVVFITPYIIHDGQIDGQRNIYEEGIYTTEFPPHISKLMTELYQGE